MKVRKLLFFVEVWNKPFESAILPSETGVKFHKWSFFSRVNSSAISEIARNKATFRKDFFLNNPD